LRTTQRVVNARAAHGARAAYAECDVCVHCGLRQTPVWCMLRRYERHLFLPSQLCVSSIYAAHPR